MKLKSIAEQNDRKSAVILDWCEPFAARVMARIHEYDDAWPKRHYTNTVFYLPSARARYGTQKPGEELRPAISPNSQGDLS